MDDSATLSDGPSGVGSLLLSETAQCGPRSVHGPSGPIVNNELRGRGDFGHVNNIRPYVFIIQGVRKEKRKYGLK